MRRRTPAPPAPLPQRHGIDPVRLRLPATGPWATVRDHLVERLPVPASLIDGMLDERAIIGADGPVTPDTPFTPGGYVWYHRDLPDEVPVPFPITIVHRDDNVVVVDKPHFLAMAPRGRHVAETALARLRRDLRLPELSPAHRLDRLTAGLAMFVVRREHRGAYQGLFQDRLVRKEYEAIAPYDPALELPRTVCSRIVKERGDLAAREVAGPPNSRSRIELAERRDGLGRYRLLPVTGRTHQLRLHMSSLGVPILADPLYPRVLPDPAPDDFSRPLQLLARTLEFTDPISGAALSLTSTRTLEAWPAGAPGRHPS
ncbi:RluA family pseudouridine synthase [Kitasatospora atroaurantiaca]|uniref:RNA pseudouridylate synthase n=1 Tax=Kitasatospora atroaurantiaca TaxID=285545 RepID=A0A561F1H0_9ACTN|nr:pseudouridine synthase [Kitasatospora atroaurantiaca]TWE21708.1 tRNA pseudouridine32 synthase/23S rRNA pseudouridine746 synthase [Kitasatospora atroaurantiaca]